jgi:hypothetical protein
MNANYATQNESSNQSFEQKRGPAPYVLERDGWHEEEFTSSTNALLSFNFSPSSAINRSATFSRRY